MAPVATVSDSQLVRRVISAKANGETLLVLADEFNPQIKAALNRENEPISQKDYNEEIKKKASSLYQRINTLKREFRKVAEVQRKQAAELLEQANSDETTDDEKLVLAENAGKLTKAADNIDLTVDKMDGVPRWPTKEGGNTGKKKDMFALAMDISSLVMEDDTPQDEDGEE